MDGLFHGKKTAKNGWLKGTPISGNLRISCFIKATTEQRTMPGADGQVRWQKLDEMCCLYNHTDACLFVYKYIYI